MLLLDFFMFFAYIVTLSDVVANAPCRSIMDLLHICQTRVNVDYTLTASMVEIYNETIHDLLSAQLQQLDIRAQGSRIQLPGMVELAVGSVEDIDQIMRLGNKNRATAATKMNSTRWGGGTELYPTLMAVWKGIWDRIKYIHIK